MLNKDNLRELAYLTYIRGIEPIKGSDNCEAALVEGWRVMVRKNTFKAGDVAIYFEIDSHVDPENPAFAFLAKKNYAVKTQKYTFGGKGNFISQGLIMSPADFGWEVITDAYGLAPIGVKVNGVKHIVQDESRFLTKELKVTYYDPADNARKGGTSQPVNKAVAFSQRHPKFTKSRFGRFLMRHKFTRNLILFFFHPKKKKNSWPEWVVKTDEERCQNMPQLFAPDGICQKIDFWWTEKIDGTSTTFTMRRKDKKLFVCSRNVAFVKGKESCYYDSNVYLEMAEKYHMEDTLRQILKEYVDWQFITIQAETYGAGVQKRDYSIAGHDMAVFNVIYKDKKGNIVRMNPYKGRAFCMHYGLPYVPVLGLNKICSTCDELLAAAAGASELDGKPREGVVFRSEDATISFKAVDNEYLLKYHGG